MSKAPETVSRVRLLVGVAVAVIVLGGLGASLVVPRGGQAAVVVDRFGDAVTLLPDRITLSAPFLGRVTRLERRNGAAVVDVPVTLALSGGAGVPARAVIELRGTGTLPISASAVRRDGWERAWQEWLEPRLGVDAAAAAGAVEASAAWRKVFPAATTGGPLDRAAVLAPAFAPLTVVSARIVPQPGEAVVRSAARDALRRLAPARGRLVVIGLDALDWQYVEELVRRGVMPNLGRLLARGSQAVVDVPPPLLSPIIWTTIATGQPPDVHGVLDFVEPDPHGGAPRPISSNARKVPALWEMAAAAGRSSTVIGWWATFPAHAIPGCAVFSDRLSEQLMGLDANVSGLADPPDAAKVASQLVVRAKDVTPAMMAPILAVTRDELAAIPEDEEAWDDPMGGAVRLMAATLTVQRLTDHELDAGANVVLSYLEGTDTVGHLFAPYRPPAMPGVDPAKARRFGPVPDRYHAYIDAWLGRIVARLGADDTLVVLSDHGFRWGDDRPTVAAGAHTPTAVFWHRPGAFFLAVGPGIPARSEREHMGVLDVAPTLLALAGLPPDPELPGREPSWLPPAPAPHAGPRQVDYAALVPPLTRAVVDLPEAARKEELAKLRALGYLAGGNEGTAAPAGTGPEPTPRPTAIPGRMEARRLHNLALSEAAAGDLTAAEAAFRQAIAADADYAPTHYAYAHLLRKTGRYDEADTQLWQAIDAGLGDPEGSIVRAASDYRQLGQPKRAAALLVTGTERFPESHAIWLNLGTTLGEQGDLGMARKCLERAVSLAPGDPFGYRNLAAAQIGMGDREAARRSLTRALQIDPSDAEVRRQLEALGGPLE